MNLFKKTTAAIALVTLVSGIFSTGVSAYSTSEVEAANALADAGIIVNHADNSAAYNLDQNVLRQEIAAVARGIASLDKETTYTKVFSDVTETTPNTWAWASVNALANAGLVAKNTEFRPEANISKAEAVGMVVKAAFGSEYAFDATLGTSWQEQVVAFAVANGVVSSFTNYDTAATRGFVFEAGSNAMASGTDDMGNILDELLGGLTGDDTTTSTGTTNTGTTNTTVKAGDVEVSLNPSSATNGTQIPSTGTIKFAAVDFTAGSADVSVDTVELKSLGLAAVPSGSKVWFEKDGKRLSGKASFSSERTAVSSFAPALVVKAGSTETLDLYVELATVAGNDFQFSGKITASSANNNNGTFVTSTLRTATYTVAPSNFDAFAIGATSVNQTADALEIGRFKIENKDISSETRDLDFQTITLRQLWNGDLLDLSNIVLERNGSVVSTETMVTGKDVTFVVNDTIKDGTSSTYYVKAKVVSVQNNGGDSYQLSLRNTSDLSLVEVLNGFRSTVSNLGTAFTTYTVNGADVTFARDTSVELSKTYAKGSSDVIFMQGTITTKAAITLEDPTLTFTSSTGASALFDTLYLQIGSSTMTWSSNTGSTAAFSGLATVNGTTTVKLYAKLKDTAGAVNIKFNSLGLSSFTKKEYVSNQNEVGVNASVGSISGVQVTVGTTNLSVNRTDNMGDTKVAKGSSNVLANEVSVAVSQGNDVNISNATYTVTASGTYTNNVFATLLIDGVAVSTKTVSGTTVTFNNVSKVVNKTATKLTVKLDFSDAYADGAFSIKLTSLDAVDTVTSATVFPTYPSAATLTVASAIGTLTTSDSNPKASLLLAGDRDQKVLAFRVKATNDSVRLRDLSFTGTNLDSLSNFRVVNSSNQVIASSTSNSTGAVAFTNIETTDSVAMDTTSTYYVVADVNTNVNGVLFTISLNRATSNVKASNGDISTMVGVIASVDSSTHLVQENRAIVAKATNSSKNLATSALRFTVTASGKDSVTLNSALFANTFGWYSTGAANIVVYKDSVSLANKLGEVAADTGLVTFNANQTVDAGSTNTYIVVVTGVVANGATTTDWAVSLSNLTISGVSANTYTNLGEFPITETK